LSAGGDGAVASCAYAIEDCGRSGQLHLAQTGDESGVDGAATGGVLESSFTPIGPWLVTADEVEDPHALDIRLWVNDELRQSANTREMIADCYELLALASSVMTLYPGDIVTTGTPEGVGPIQAGDQVRLWIERIGEFTVDVAMKG
ncbi:MAG: fumarylacetoacetate hydrolase family protein, partial [Alicyclobacillus herbarius]|uniref:fumarylacetoacetate hydrolase family protein n=1 Tax=Alicyclobacillus herbarius TaxID=122960 RepID=UPI0023571F3E